MSITGQEEPGPDSRHSRALLISRPPPRQSPNSQALIRGPSQQDLVHRGLGRTLNKGFDYVGRKVEEFGGRVGYKLGHGAAAKGEKIDKRFGEDPEETIKRLDLLFDALDQRPLPEADQNWIDQVQHLCCAILKCSTSVKKLEAQVQAFKEIIRLCTSYPPIRRLFLRSKHLPPFPKEDVSKLIIIWENDNSSQFSEWDFYQELASCSLVGHASTMLTESCRASNFCQSELGSCVIQQLVGMLDDTAIDGPWRMLTIRYISSILRLKCFWELKNDSVWRILRQLLIAGSKLFEELSQLLSHTQEISTQCPFDVYGLDTLIHRLLLHIEQLPRSTDPIFVSVQYALLDELDNSPAIVEKFLSRTYQALSQIPSIRSYQPDKVTDESLRLDGTANKRSSASLVGSSSIASSEAAEKAKREVREEGRAKQRQAYENVASPTAAESAAGPLPVIPNTDGRIVSIDDEASTISRAAGEPFSAADAAAMAAAFRNALRKPDFAGQPMKEGAGADGASTISGADSAGESFSPTDAAVMAAAFRNVMRKPDFAREADGGRRVSGLRSRRGR